MIIKKKKFNKSKIKKKSTKKKSTKKKSTKKKSTKRKRKNPLSEKDIANIQIASLMMKPGDYIDFGKIKIMIDGKLIEYPRRLVQTEKGLHDWTPMTWDYYTWDENDPTSCPRAKIPKKMTKFSLTSL